MSDIIYKTAKRVDALERMLADVLSRLEVLEGYEVEISRPTSTGNSGTLNRTPAPKRIKE